MCSHRLNHCRSERAAQRHSRTGLRQHPAACRLCVVLRPDVDCFFFFFSSRRRHTILQGDWSSDVCSSDLYPRDSRSPEHWAYCAAEWHPRSEEHTSELQSPCNLVCRLLLEKKKEKNAAAAVHVSRRPSRRHPARSASP